MVDEIVTAQNEDQFEQLIQGLIDNRFGICTDFLDEALLNGLRNNLLRFKQEGLMHPAGVGRKFDYQKNATIRGDVIRWLEKDTSDVFERLLLDKIGQFIVYLNQSCYTSINDYEFHYAYYEVNSFYKRHFDKFKSDRGRKFSLVIYLNDEWKVSDGGKLSLYLDENKTEEISPIGGQAVFFKSDEVEHEVSPSPTRYRISIAGWLKNT